MFRLACIVAPWLLIHLHWGWIAYLIPPPHTHTPEVPYGNHFCESVFLPPHLLPGGHKHIPPPPPPPPPYKRLYIFDTLPPRELYLRSLKTCNFEKITDGSYLFDIHVVYMRA